MGRTLGWEMETEWKRVRSAWPRLGGDHGQDLWENL